jgi:hypothetical protein
MTERHDTAPLESMIRRLRDALSECAEEGGWPETWIADVFEESRELVPDEPDTPAVDRRETPPQDPRMSETAICERCQMRVPDRLATWDIGVRGSAAARCAACRPCGATPEEQAANRAEVVAMRKARR